MNVLLHRTVAMVVLSVLFNQTVPTLGEQPDNDAEIPLVWHDLGAGKALAVEQQRPLLIHFTADWCHWCKVMQRDTYAHLEVRKMMHSAFVAVMVDADREPRLRSEFMVQGLPTVWFLTAEGQPITSIPGFVDGSTFLQVLRWIDTGAFREQPFKDFQAADS
jgi:thioredoxin-related protein